MPVSTTGLALPLPPVELRFMGESDEKLIDVGDELAGLLVSHGLTDAASILDVGCGYGRLALGILHSTHHRGPYLGFDILARHVEWCQTRLSPSFPTMRFVRLDVRNERYNPKGTIEATQATFPTGAGSIDVIAMFSVYTHLYRPDIERYLAETRRVLRPGAVAVTTWFLFDEARLPQVTSEQSMHRMIHVLDSVTRYSDEGNPLRAIAYDQGAVEGMARAAGLEITAVERGTWAGEPGRSYQDVVVFRRPSGGLGRFVARVFGRQPGGSSA